MKNLKISTRLALLTGGLCVLIAAVGAVGLYGTSSTSDSLKTVYEDRTVPAAQLAEIQNRTMRNQQLLQEAILDSQPAKLSRNLAELDTNVAAVTKTWDAYMATYLTPEEKELALVFAEARKKFVTGGLRVAEAALREGRVEEAKHVVLAVMPGLYAPVDKGLSDLLKLQLEVAQHEYNDAVARYGFVRTLTIGAAALAAAFAVIFGWLLTRNLMRALGAEPQAVKEVAESVAAGDLSRTIELRAGDQASVMAAMKRMADSLAGIVVSVRQNAESVATASAQIASGNSDLSSRTEEQASALEETAASMEELASTVKQNADNARQANQLAQGASTVAMKGGDVVGQVVQTMKGINDSSKQIADIISVIDGIAFQTNILALNAAVEAARAGEQGRGFAVVASEVRNLAQRSAEAAKQIKTLITASVERVEQGTALVDQAGGTMQEVVQSIRRVTDIMGEISSASVEQSAGVAQVNEAVSQMDQTTQQNAALVEESAAAAESLKSQAQQLVQAMAVFSVSPATGRPAAAAAAAAPAASGWGGDERRGAHRAVNVVRPAFAAKRPAAASPQAPVPAATGTDGDWATF